MTVCTTQEVTKRCRLSWLTNSALVYEPKCRGRGLGGELWCLSQWIQLYTGAQINFGDLIPYLTYGTTFPSKRTTNVYWQNLCVNVVCRSMVQKARIIEIYEQKRALSCSSVKVVMGWRLFVVLVRILPVEAPASRGRKKILVFIY
jgi:hypothetical protein